MSGESKRSDRERRTPTPPVGKGRNAKGVCVE
jgi:hypothetical protein